MAKTNKASKTTARSKGKTTIRTHYASFGRGVHVPLVEAVQMASTAPHNRDTPVPVAAQKRIGIIGHVMSAIRRVAGV